MTAKPCNDHFFVWYSDCKSYICGYCGLHLEKSKCELCGWPEPELDDAIPKEVK